MISRSKEKPELTKLKAIQRVWTGSKRVGEHKFVDENGFTVNPFCDLDKSDVKGVVDKEITMCFSLASLN